MSQKVLIEGICAILIKMYLIDMNLKVQEEGGGVCLLMQDGSLGCLNKMSIL